MRPSSSPRRVGASSRKSLGWFVLLAALVALIAATGPGCGGAGGKPRKKRSGKKTEQPDKGKDSGAQSAPEKDPTIPLPVTSEQKRLVEGLGAKDPEHWKQAEETLNGMGADAIPALNWGLQFTLQNVRARCANILSRMNKSEKMIPGAIDALKMYPDDTSSHEAGIRRWAAKVLSDLYSVYTEEAIRGGIERDKDPGVKALLSSGAVKLGHKTFVSHIIRALAAEDPDAAQIAVEELTALVPEADVDAGGFSSKSLEARKAKSEELMSWWKSNYESVKIVPPTKNYDPWPVEVTIYEWKPSGEGISFEDEREVELNIRDAEKALARGDLREVTGRYAAAFRFSNRERMDLALLHHEYWRQLGPDNADKSYKYLREKLIPLHPTDERFWIAAAKSAYASGGKMGRDWALECLRYALILVPDHEEALALKKEYEGG